MREKGSGDQPIPEWYNLWSVVGLQPVLSKLPLPSWLSA